MCDKGCKINSTPYTRIKKRSSFEWTAAGENRPKLPKIQTSADKVAFVFWNIHKILFIHYLQKSKTIIGEYYMALLDRLKEEIKKKRPQMKKKKYCSIKTTASQND